MKIILLLTFTCLVGSSLLAQQVISSAGGNATGAGGTISYTIGQVDYTSNVGINGSVMQGVQQPYEISAITGLEESKEITLQWSVYPNPTSDFLKLSLRNPEVYGLNVENLIYQLYDMQGNLLQEKKLEDNETSVKMGDLQPSTYILKIIQKQGVRSHQNTKSQIELKTFKIIKY